MEVALVLVGASVAGAVIGAMATRIRQPQTREARALPMVSCTQTTSTSTSVFALEPAKKVRRIGNMQQVQQHDILRSCAEAVSNAEVQLESACSAQRALATKVVAVQQELKICRAAMHQSCVKLRDGFWTSRQEAEQHIKALLLVGRKFSFDPRLLEALRLGQITDDVISFLEEGLHDAEMKIGQRLAGMAVEAARGLHAMKEAASRVQEAKRRQLECFEEFRRSQLSLSVPARKYPEDSCSFKNREPSLTYQDLPVLQDIPARPTCSLVVEDDLDEERDIDSASFQLNNPPAMVAFWEESTVEVSTTIVTSTAQEELQDALWDALRAPITSEAISTSADLVAVPSTKTLKRGRADAGIDVIDGEEQSSSAGLAVLTLLQHGDEEGLSAIKGLKPDDVKKILAHRKKNGSIESVASLPSILGRKLSLKKLLADNSF